MSDLCYWELRDRGDESAIGYTLDDRADEEDYVYVAVVADHLRVFQSQAVAQHIRARLTLATTTSGRVRMLALLGRFGEPADAELAGRFVNDSDELVANVACEATLRLSDPLLVPEGWREL